MPRLFVALRPPPEQRAILLDLMGGVPGARWQDEEQLHVTLRFLGEVDRHVAADIDAALGQVRVAPVPLAIAGVGCSDRHGRIDSLWAGVRSDPVLLHLQKSIERAMVQVGLPPERRAYHPHVTVARCNRATGPVNGWLARHAGATAPEATVDGMLLFESTLGGEGARYEALARYQLR